VVNVFGHVTDPGQEDFRINCRSVARELSFAVL